MRIISWNCNGALRNKRTALDGLKPDVLVVQECEDPDRSPREYRSWAGTYLWHGDNKNRGVGVFSRSGIALDRLDWDDDGLQLLLPCRIDDRFTLIAAWLKHANSPNFRYIGQLWKYLQLHRDRIARGPVLLCGDLNSNTRWDEWDRWWNHSDVVRELEQIGVRSIYHDAYAEPQGEETRPTLFHQRNPAKPYHVDYMFASSDFYSRCEIAVGSATDWLALSDHMPLILDIE